MTENNTSLKIISLQKMFSNQILRRYALQKIAKRKPKESKEDNSFLEHALWVEQAFTESFVNIGKNRREGTRKEKGEMIVK